jgi:aspartyl/asparaginyl beta-hydroxylase (cupin superfamily)
MDKDEEKLRNKFNKFMIAKEKYRKTKFRTEQSRSIFKLKIEKMLKNLKELSDIIQEKENKISKEIISSVDKVHEKKPIVKIEYDTYEIEY